MFNMLLDILTKKLTNEIYVIAEIGQNHQGSLETAKQMILQAKKAGCHCVKFQKSDLQTKFTRSALNREYVSDHSWGRTYGEHKEYLEFTKDQYLELQAYSHAVKIDFTASAMDERSLEFLADLNVPFIKIGSGDANNFPLLTKAASLGIPLVISTGMQTMSTVEKIVDIMSRASNNMFALMHCVSAYPTPPSHCNLRLISLLMKRFPNVIIGYSGHELGINITKAAVLLGARIIERHFTLNKNQKGSDHRCSLEPRELYDLLHDLEQLRQNKFLYNNSCKVEEIHRILGNNEELKDALKEIDIKDIMPCELPCRSKLGKSIVAARNLDKGHKLKSGDLAIKVSEPSGLTAERYFDVIDMKLKCNIYEDDPITEDMLL